MSRTNSPFPVDGALSRRGFLLGSAAAAAWTAGAGSGLALAGETARRGGTLRVGLVGGGNAETLDPHKALAETDLARTNNLFEKLTDYDYDGSIINVLATDFLARPGARIWRLKLRAGVRWHNGRPLTSDDVVYSLRRILHDKLQGASDLSFVQAKNIRRIDPRTVELRLDQPIADLRSSLASRALSIIPEGAKSFVRPVGTGPFRFSSFTRGQRSEFDRFDGYHQSPRPYVDRLVLISLDDPSARINALQARQVDAISGVAYPQIATVQGAGLKILKASTGGFVGMTMCCTQAPFTDKQVRQAFRLLVDRPKTIATTLLGYGKLGNDLAMPFDPSFASGLPQHEYDPQRAAALLKAAGQENLAVSLYTSSAGPAMLESATLFAQTAKEGGVTVNLDQVPADQYYSDKYLKAPFAQTQWGQRTLDSWILQAVDSKAPYNETCWMRPDFDALTRKARATLDPKKRKELYGEAQRMLYDEGGYIIWGFGQITDAYSPKLRGLRPSVIRNLGYFTFKDVSFA